MAMVNDDKRQSYDSSAPTWSQVGSYLMRCFTLCNLHRKWLMWQL